MTSVGLIGFGAIGRSIVDLWHSLPSPSFHLAGACVRPQQIERAQGAMPANTLICDDIEQLLNIRPDCIIEAAGHAVVQSHGARILRRGCSIYLLSVGSLADAALRGSLVSAAGEGNSHILIPAGALAGFDGLLTLACDNLRSVKYISTKPCKAWQGTVAAETHELGRLTRRTVIFQGNAGEAARLFPKNANLAAAVALAGIGFERTRVELVADPNASGNVGTVEAVSRSTTLTLSVASNPSSNPKTSANVGASVIAALRNGTAAVRFV
jgi:aspartate dehydrogenase